jgi:predicted transposase/invertase (TIGR01784 family)
MNKIKKYINNQNIKEDNENKKGINSTKIPQLIYNAMFEVVFDDSVEVIIAIINDCYSTNYKVGKDKIEVEKREVPREFIGEKKFTCDYIIVVNDYYLYNIEINRTYYNGLFDRNYNYILKLNATRIPKGTKYKDLSKYQANQINFNGFSRKGVPGIDIEGMMSYVTNEPRYKNIGILQFDVEFCHNMIYNKDNKEDITKVSKLYRWGAVFKAETLEEIDYILGSDMLDMGIKKKFLDRIKKASKDKIVLSEVSLECDYAGSMQDEIDDAKELARIEGRNEGREEGIKEGKVEGRAEGMAEGITQKTIEVIKAMLKKSMSLQDISDITGKTEEEILEIKESM